MQEALTPFESLPISAVGVYNITFGSNGHVKEPEGLITENYRRCRPDPEFHQNRRVKSIVKGHQRISVTACSHVFNTPLGTIDETGRPVTWGYLPEYRPTYDVFRMNHYACQSYEYFKSFKTTSGHADAGANVIRGEDWWVEFDRNEEYDTSLCRFTGELRELVGWLDDTAVAKNFFVAGANPAEETPPAVSAVEPAVDLFKYKHKFYNEPLADYLKEIPVSDISEHLGLLFYFATDINPKLIVELGTGSGNSTRALLAAASISKAALLSIDNSDCTEFANGNRDLLHFIQADDVAFGTNEFSDWCRGHSLKPAIDILFVDTSHEYDHTKQEIAVWGRYLSKNGIMLFHGTNPGNGCKKTDDSIPDGHDSDRGAIKAIEEFVGRHYDEYSFFYDLTETYSLIHFPFSNGLTVIKKRDQRALLP
jgi:predicted O-methyltransferase YrrM